VVVSVAVRAVSVRMERFQKIHKSGLKQA